MRVEVEEVVALVADEVVAGAWTATGDADGLRHLNGGFEGGVVDGRDTVDAEANTQDDKDGLEGVIWRLLGGELDEFVRVDVAVVGASVDAEIGRVVLVSQRSVILSAIDVLQMRCDEVDSL